MTVKKMSTLCKVMQHVGIKISKGSGTHEACAIMHQNSEAKWMHTSQPRTQQTTSKRMDVRMSLNVIQYHSSFIICHSYVSVSQNGGQFPTHHPFIWDFPYVFPEKSTCLNHHQRARSSHLHAACVAVTAAAASSSSSSAMSCRHQSWRCWMVFDNGKATN